MESASGNSNNGGKTMYEKQRDENVAENNDLLASLGLTPINMCNEPRKRAKRAHDTSVQATQHHNLRPRPQKSHAMNLNGQVDDVAGEGVADIDEEYVVEEDDWEFESTRDFLSDNEDCHRNTEEKRNGRGITKLNEVFARKPNMPKIKVMVNEYGQAIGENARRFSGAIGVHVRQNISIACPDWRLVDEDLKDAVWSAMKLYFDIYDKAKDWTLDQAAKKWKDFKENLKKEFFKGEVSEEKLRSKQGKRLNDDDWNYLKKHWSSLETIAKAEIAKVNRAKLSIHHTTGSKSFACNRHELNKLKAIIEAQPELTEKSIQEGDAFAATCGQKEPKGRVWCFGLGPTPQSVGTPGVKHYTPTRVQMQVREFKRQESDQTALEQRIVELEAELARERLARERLARERSSMENVSQNGSNSQHHESPRSEENYVETNHIAEVRDGAYANNSNEYEYVLVRRAPPDEQPHRSNSSQFVQPNTFATASFMQHPHSSPIPTTIVVQPRQPSPIPTDPVVRTAQSSPDGAGPLGNAVKNHISHDDLIGKEIIHYAL